MFVIAMAFIFVALLALVGDADTLMVHYSRASALALIGAQAGASQIDLDAFYRDGTKQLLVGTAKSACEAAAQPTNQFQATCNADVVTGTVTATVHEDVKMPVPVFGLTAPISVTRQGRAVFGGAAPGP
jgi:hypothetical protein